MVMTPQNLPDEHRLFRKYLPNRGGTIYEVGCAPGRYLAYFARFREMQVAGVEYVEEAVELTRRNFEIQGIVGDVEWGDFFTYSLPESQYDTVLSCGFIEHWPDTQAVVDRIVRIARPDGGYVVTLVPNLEGLHGRLMKRFDRQLYDGHVVITAQQLRRFHEQAGVDTLFCDYCRPPLIRVYPGLGDEAFARRAILGRVVRVSQKLFNGGFRRICQYTGWMPRSRWLTPTVLYIGRRGGPVSESSGTGD